MSVNSPLYWAKWDFEAALARGESTEYHSFASLAHLSYFWSIFKYIIQNKKIKTLNLNSNEFKKKLNICWKNLESTDNIQVFKKP